MANTASSVPPPSSLPSVTATEAKNSFGAVLDRVMTEGRVAITKHDEVRAVLLSASEYEALLSNQHDPIRDLEHEFDGLLARMQSPKARAAGRALFEAGPLRLGRAARASARKR